MARNVRRSRVESRCGAIGSSSLLSLETGERARAMDRNRPVIVCCASGTRSAMAAHALRRQGSERVSKAGS
jgi:rhodanese-related sulfurtransferase